MVWVVGLGVAWSRDRRGALSCHQFLAHLTTNSILVTKLVIGPFFLQFINIISRYLIKSMLHLEEEKNIYITIIIIVAGRNWLS